MPGRGKKVLKGVYNRGDPPLPIPNREVKPLSADGTAVRWESRLAPNSEASYSDVTRFFYNVIFFFILAKPGKPAVETAREDVNAWLGPKLESRYPILYIDATYVLTRRDESVSNEAYYTVLISSLSGK